MDSISNYLILIPAAPLAAAILIPLLAPRLLKNLGDAFPAAVTIIAFTVSCLSSLLLVREVIYHQKNLPSQNSTFERVVPLWTWADISKAYYQQLTPPISDTAQSPVEGGARDFTIEIALRADGLTAMMLAMVTFVSLLVAIFAAGYMHGDRGFWRFFTYISLFVFSMTMLVSASNFLLLFVFWEAVGVCSYLLIGFWYEKASASAAGMKAFVVNRVGDLGFALAIMLIWTTFGSLNYHSTALRTDSDGTTHRVAVDSMYSPSAGDSIQRGVLERSAGEYQRGTVALAICLLLLLGACGKSAQFPLHVWLPDAMEGPTPVSALIHAATMVTAGVYMVTRCSPLFAGSPEAQLVVSCIGGFTALMAALIAVTQFDLKRVLAYSTISQLGYMFLALGTGTFFGITAGMFHLFTHAFFKALLFLGSGSVMHAMGNVIDMRRFGGLRRIMPVTHWTFLIGCLALSGVFPLAGFWSKDAILGAVEERSHELSSHHHETHSGELDSGGEAASNEAALEAAWTLWSPESAGRVYAALYYIALFTAFLTTFYTFRAFFLTFYGEERVPPEAGHHAHESPPVMAGPLIALAICAVFVGFWHGSLTRFISFTPQLASEAVPGVRGETEFHIQIAAISTVVALAGIGLAMFLYLESRREVDWIASLMSFQWYRRLLDADRYARMRRWSWVGATRRAANRVYLGWLAVLLGRIVQTVLWIVSAPLLVFSFITPYRLSAGKFYFDELYNFLIVRPLRGIASLLYGVDRAVIDGTVNAIGRVPLRIGNLMRSLQMGLVQFYALCMALGMLLLVLVRVLWSS